MKSLLKEMIEGVCICSGGRRGNLRRESLRHLTTISIVYDFNNLGASTLATLDTFSVVKCASKSVFMGKKWPTNCFFFLAFSHSFAFNISNVNYQLDGQIRMYLSLILLRQQKFQRAIYVTQVFPLFQGREIQFHWEMCIQIYILFFKFTMNSIIKLILLLTIIIKHYY